MKKVTRYESINGNLYDSEELALKADKDKEIFNHIADHYGYNDFPLDKVLEMLRDKKLRDLVDKEIKE